MASLQMTTRSSLPEPQRATSTSPNVVSTSTSSSSSVKSSQTHVTMLGQKRAKEEEEEESEATWVVKKVKVESGEQFMPLQESISAPLQEDHIEQMIEELLYYGSIELCSGHATYQ